MLSFDEKSKKYIKPLKPWSRFYYLLFQLEHWTLDERGKTLVNAIKIGQSNEK
jgi:hypothetical protein